MDKKLMAPLHPTFCFNGPMMVNVNYDSINIDWLMTRKSGCIVFVDLMDAWSQTNLSQVWFD